MPQGLEGALHGGRPRAQPLPHPQRSPGRTATRRRLTTHQSAMLLNTRFATRFLPSMSGSTLSPSTAGPSSAPSDTTQATRTARRSTRPCASPQRSQTRRRMPFLIQYESHKHSKQICLQLPRPAADPTRNDGRAEQPFGDPARLRIKKLNIDPNAAPRPHHRPTPRTHAAHAQGPDRHQDPIQANDRTGQTRLEPPSHPVHSRLRAHAHAYIQGNCKSIYYSSSPPAP